MPVESSVHFKINIPVALKERLSALADESGRSLTSEILMRLERSLKFPMAEETQASIDDLYSRVEELERAIRELEVNSSGRDPSPGN